MIAFVKLQKGNCWTTQNTMALWLMALLRRQYAVLWQLDNDEHVATESSTSISMARRRSARAARGNPQDKHS
jgi:hypothetical protein